MTTEQITKNLQALMPGIKDRPSINKGNRCSVSVRGVTATGTIRSSCTSTGPGGIAVLVELDGTNHMVWVPVTIIGQE
jgi:hypothetical protein